MGFLLDYARQPAAYRVPDNRSALERIVENFKNLFSRGGKVEGNTISNADDLLSLAEKVSRGMKGEQTEVMGRHNKALRVLGEREAISKSHSTISKTLRSSTESMITPRLVLHLTEGRGTGGPSRLMITSTLETGTTKLLETKAY